MSRRLVPVILVAISATSATSAFGQIRGVSPPPVTVQASVAGGRINGLVRDEAGRALDGVSVVATGSSLATVRSDTAGRFSLFLPAGDYMLRATRVGYVSTYREPVRVVSNVPLERTITLFKQTPTDLDTDALVLASLLPPQARPSPGSTGPGEHAHSEMAWRLRNLPRTVLRDEGMTAFPDRGATDFRPTRTLFDRAMSGSARAASSFLTGLTSTDFRGQVNFVTTGSMTLVGGRPDEWSRGIAYAALGAPVGASGDWMVRGALDTGDVSSWAVLWVYEARQDERHRLQAGVSYAKQGVMTASSASMASATLGSRSVGSVYARDRWRAQPNLELEYGLRLDRVDYVATPNLTSPHVGARLTVLPQMMVIFAAGRRMVAPGANEFLPPSSAGPWLPPERTFSSLTYGAPLNVERVGHVEGGIDYHWDRRHDRVIRLRRFAEDVTNQISTIFGAWAASDEGHYHVATAGDARVEGWRVGLGGSIVRGVRGTIDYTRADATWADHVVLRSTRRAAPSAVRRGREQSHDVTSSIAATIPGLSTDVKVAYRLNSAFSAAPRQTRSPLLDGRFDVEVRQALPYQPIRGGHLEVLFAVRSLFRDFERAGSYYDELLTVAPPMRLTGGVQVRF